MPLSSDRCGFFLPDFPPPLRRYYLKNFHFVLRNRLMKETVLAASLALSLLSSPAFAAETADVVVVGAGAAGLSASIGAAMRGAKRK